MKIFTNYLKTLQKQNLIDITEHSHRTALEILLNKIATDIPNQKTNILHEPKRQGKNGSPDFMVSVPAGIIGYIENKKITQNLNETISSAQIEKYKRLSPSLLLTNYVEFVWLKGDEVFREKLCDITDINNKSFKINAENETKVFQLIRNFLSVAPQGIANIQTLAFALAERTRYLFIILYEYLIEQEKDESLQDEIWGTYQEFVNTVYAELSVADFTDTFAQTLTYGLFLAKLNKDNKELITLRNIDLQIPTNFALIKNIVGLLKYIKKEKYSKALWIVEELLSIINNIDLNAIQESLSFSNRKSKSKTEYKDPYIYFYEIFLGAYNPKLRKSRGVYYTPHAVVRFIIAAIDEVLKDKRLFGIRNGMANYQKVNILDFATGTGTFLLEILEQLNDKHPFNKPEGNKIIRKHIHNLYGFEFLIAPYVISHLKLTQYLKENGYDIPNRLQIYLTNTLEDKEPAKSFFIPKLSEEGKLAQEVKRDKKILVITGNPPYSGHSANASFKIEKENITNEKGTREVKKKIDTWIGSLIRDYYNINGVSIKEANSKWLQDDYVKFIRFAQHKIEQTGEGVVAIITNHAFLNNPTFRAMRYNLMQAFDEIYIIDLHGNSKKKETTPTGEKDENVFDIQQGVCISVLIKKKGLKKTVKITNFWGKQAIKYKQLYETSWKDINWISLKPSQPFYLFAEQNLELKEKYHSWWSVKDIFLKSSIGIATHRDKFAVDFNFDAIYKRISTFIKTEKNVIDILTEFKLKESSKFKVLKTKKILKNKTDAQIKKAIINYDYRPFDKRKIFYEDCILDRARMLNMSNIIKGNIAINIPRQTFKNDYKHIFVSKNISDLNLLQSANGQNVFFLYYYEVNIDKKTKSHIDTKLVNFQEAFKKMLAQKYADRFSPEQILGYIYAILHSPTYRSKYVDFLKIDFPKIPFCDNISYFETISTLGTQLIAAHLMEEIPEFDIATTYDGKVGQDMVEKITFRAAKNAGRLYINKTNYFEPVPKAIFEFYIGGYKVLHKYLKERKGRDLEIEEIQQIKDIANIIAFTIEKMKEIDCLVQKIC